MSDKEYFSVDPRDVVGYGRLTKRELFAALAMQGMISNDYIAGEAYDQVARRCVQQADALLKELNK